MSDEDYISWSSRHALVKFGAERTPAEMSVDFSCYSSAARQGFLADLKTPDSMSVTQAGRRHAQERALRNTHARLSKVGR
jgi:hypothetical protein